jgi:hypothetical protein
MASELPTKVMNPQASILDRHDDPFAPREGKTLIWKDINMTLVCAVLFCSVIYERNVFVVLLFALSGPSLDFTVSSFLCFCDASYRLPKATNRNASC